MKKDKEEVFWKSLEEKVKEKVKERVKEIVKEDLGANFTESAIDEGFLESVLENLSAERLKETSEERLKLLLGDNFIESGIVNNEFVKFLLDRFVQGVVDGFAPDLAYDIMDSLEE